MEEELLDAEWDLKDSNTMFDVVYIQEEDEGALTQPLDNKSSWTLESTKCFIQLCRERQDQFKNKVFRKKGIYQDISDTLLEKGFIFSSDDLDRKWRNLKSYYFSNSHLENGKTVVCKTFWPYYKEMHSIYKNHPRHKRRNQLNFRKTATSTSSCKKGAKIAQINTAKTLLLEKVTEEINKLQQVTASIDMSNQLQERMNNLAEEWLTNETSDENAASWWRNLTEEKHQNFFRMSSESFTALQAEINYFENKDNESKDIPLLATIYFLGNLQTLQTITEYFNVNFKKKTLVKQLKRILLLSGLYLQWPLESEAAMICNAFSKQHQFPGVVGVLGCGYIAIKAKKDKNKLYYNKYLESNVVYLQAVCDSNCLLRHVSVGIPGSKPVENVLRNSPLYSKLADKNGYLLKNQWHVVGGSEYPQFPTLLTPFKDEGITERQKGFNKQLTGVLGMIEKTFACVNNRFPRLNSVEDFEPDMASVIISAVCVLYNFITVKKDNFNLYL